VPLGTGLHHGIAHGHRSSTNGCVWRRVHPICFRCEGGEFFLHEKQAARKGRRVRPAGWFSETDRMHNVRVRVVQSTDRIPGPLRRPGFLQDSCGRRFESCRRRRKTRCSSAVEHMTEPSQEKVLGPGIRSPCFHHVVRRNRRLKHQHTNNNRPERRALS